MKTTLVTMVVAALALSSFAQGTLNVLNTLGASPVLFRSQIYGLEPGNIGLSLHGNSAAGTPAGSTVYSGPLLTGTGYTFAVYYGAATVTEAHALNLLVTAPFRTGAAAGLIFPFIDFVLPGIPSGARAQLEVRVWDNQGGTVTSWGSSQYRGSSGMFLSQPLGGGVLLSPDMTGWQSFNVYSIVPEPSAFLLAGLGATAFLIFRRGKQLGWSWHLRSQVPER